MRIVIIGCGRIGAHVARMLAASGHDVCVVDADTSSLTRLGEGFRGRTVVGAGFDEHVLEEADVRHAEAVAVLTNVDSTNFMVAQAVVKLFDIPPARVCVRINDPEFVPLYNDLGLAGVDLPDLVLAHIRGGLSAERGAGG